MKHQIIPLKEKNRKVFGFSEEQIIFSSKGHHSFESLFSSSIKSGLLESVQTIPVESLQEIYFNEKEEYFTIKYTKGGKTKKNNVLLQEADLRESVVAEIAALKQLHKTTVDESKTQPLLLNLLGIIAIPIFTWILRMVAIDAQNGEEYVATGRRSGLKNLVADAVEAIGPTGITIIGIATLIYMIYVTYNRYQNPATEIKYS